MNQKQDSIKEMLDLLKGDYNFPVKLWVWGKVIKEWAGIVIGSAIFFLVALFIILSIKGAGSNVELQPAEVTQSIEEKEKMRKEKTAVHTLQLFLFLPFWLFKTTHFVSITIIFLRIYVAWFSDVNNVVIFKLVVIWVESVCHHTDS